MLSEGLVEQTPPLLGFRQIPAIKALCRCKDLNLASSYACLTNLTHLIPSDVCHQRLNGDFRCLEITPEKRGYAFLNRLKLTRSLRLPMSKGIEVTQLISIIITEIHHLRVRGLTFCLMFIEKDKKSLT